MRTAGPAGLWVVILTRKVHIPSSGAPAAALYGALEGRSGRGTARAWGALPEPDRRAWGLSKMEAVCLFPSVRTALSQGKFKLSHRLLMSEPQLSGTHTHTHTRTQWSLNSQNRCRKGQALMFTTHTMGPAALPKSLDQAVLSGP